MLRILCYAQTAAAFFALSFAVAAVGQHAPARKCPDKCNCQETGRCGCEQCPTEMSAGLAKRAVREGKWLVAFVAVKPRDVAGCITYNSVRNEPGLPLRYVAVFVPDGTGGGRRVDLPPDATDDAIRAAGEPKPLAVAPPPGMPKTR